MRWTRFPTSLALTLALCGSVSVSKGFGMGPWSADSLGMTAIAVETALAAEPESKTELKENRRAVAIGLAVLLGPFGAHRLYLGTKAKVPVLYGLTFGGFGILVLIDAAHLIFSKDLAPFSGNGKVLMWSGEGATPP